MEYAMLKPNHILRLLLEPYATRMICCAFTIFEREALTHSASGVLTRLHGGGDVLLPAPLLLELLVLPFSASSLQSYLGLLLLLPSLAGTFKTDH